MGALDPREHRFDLIWSEGAAYHLTFEGAMRAWRPLLPRGGVAVVSELSWFGPARPRPAADFWAAVYPAMGDEGENVERAERHGFDLVFTQRLPSTAWWQNYYGPLLERIEARTAAASPAMRQVIGETHREIDLFRRYSDAYGYTFYVLAGSGVLQSGVRRT